MTVPSHGPHLRIVDNSEAVPPIRLPLPGMGFVIGAYRAVEHLGGAGSGHRSSPFWRAQDARTVEDVALTVLPVESQSQVREIVDAVEAVRHPHLLPVSDVVEDETRLALACPWPRGGRLVELVRRRGVLSVGETVTVVLPLAAALAELHRLEIRHGWVCPEAIWFDARGRPLLGAPAVGIAVGAVAGQDALGSADVAPEVLRQARTGPAGPAADVFSLASVTLFCLTGRSAWPADEPADVLVQSAAGQWPDPPDEVGHPQLLALLRSMLRPDPADRPGADEIVRRLCAAGSPGPEPIRFGAGPCPTPASAKRWRGWANHADRAPDPSNAAPDPSNSDSEPEPEPEPEVEPEPEPEPEAADDRAAAGVRRRGPLARLAIALLSALLLTVLVAQVGNWLSDPPTAADTAAPAGPDWTGVVIELDLARSRALAEGDPALLEQVYLPGSAAAAADAAIIDALADNGWRVLDGRHDIVSVQVLDGAGSDTGSDTGSGSGSDSGSVSGSVSG
ncbi:MAG TPA: protein kinase, partial [Nakamurella sp.]